MADETGIMVLNCEMVRVKNRTPVTCGLIG